MTSASVRGRRRSAKGEWVGTLDIGVVNESKQYCRQTAEEMLRVCVDFYTISANLLDRFALHFFKRMHSQGHEHH